MNMKKMMSVADKVLDFNEDYHIITPSAMPLENLREDKHSADDRILMKGFYTVPGVIEP